MTSYRGSDNVEKAREEKITGTVDSVTYRNDDNGFAVITLDMGDELLTVVGDLGNVDEGEELELTGSFSEHPKFGHQFKAVSCVRSLPVEVSAIQRYLASGVVKGIGAVTAKALVKHFGAETLDILEKNPERLTEVNGITETKAKKYSDEFLKVIGFRNVIGYFSKLGTPTVYGVKAWKRYGDKTISLIEHNPYILCGSGVELPFMTAEEIARDKGIAPDNYLRLSAGIKYVLNENALSGHTCLPKDKLIDVASNFLKCDKELINKTIVSEVEDEYLYIYVKNQEKKSKQYVMLKEYFTAEDYISRRLSIMNSLAFDTGINYDEVIDIAEEEFNITYEEKQRLAINTALSKGFMILTGGPGTGKTTTLNGIISLLEQQGQKVFICAPTGRAAKRASELTGREAKTIHRLLGVIPSEGDQFRFDHNEENLLECDALVIDEMSMVDVLLFESLLRAIKINCKLIMVGDSDQLPSVGAGNLLHDIIKSGTVPVIALTEIFRQASESAIVTNAHKIVKGEMPDLSRNNSDFFFMQRLDFQSCAELTVDLCLNRLPKTYGLSPIDDIQVLSPTRKGPLGTVELNKLLQAELNPPSRDKSEIKTPLYTFRLGDKVMQVKNDYDLEWEKDKEEGSGIFNGDIGVITKLNRILGVMEIDFDGRICKYDIKNLDNLELSYAATVHKSQGCEFDAVIIPILGGYDRLYFRNLLYTAVTRAKKLLIIVGSAKRLEFMVNNNIRMNRYTCLEDMLRNDSFGGNTDSSTEGSEDE